MKMTSPDFSPLARQYAQSRPTYPAELFSYLAGLVDRRRLAWDCATGNGQAALDLVKHFERVVATDVSAEQIRHAAPYPQIEYRIAQAEQSGLDDQSVDLVTVASAIHWFDLDRFYAEVRRVVCSGGVLAAWTYHVGYVEPPFDEIFWRFYRDVISPYFAPGAKLVDERYETITLPGEPIAGANFSVSAKWNLKQMLAFIASWSGTQQYLKARGEDPVAQIAEELEHLWGGHGNVHTVRWPLYMQISRI
jgi:ubiquinone/menaquinone biosynthesis C-methylase UbiE